LHIACSVLVASPAVVSIVFLCLYVESYETQST